MAKGTKGAFRAGKVLSPDSKWTGEEPDWRGWEEWDLDKFYATRARMLRFYSYYLTSADLKPAILAYMKAKKYSKADIDLVKGANPNLIPMVIGKLIRSLDLGMPSIHPRAQEYVESLPFYEHDEENPIKAKDDHETLANEIHKTLVFLRDNVKIKEEMTLEDPNAPKKPTPNPLQRLRDKVEKEVIHPLEMMMDDWCEKAEHTKVEPLKLTSYIRDGAIPPAGCKFITAWLNRHLEEYRGAYDKEDPELVEGYSYLTRPALRNRISNLESMQAEVDKFSAVAKTMRKPRVKKTKDATKQVTRLKYQVNSKEYGLDSVSPIRIPAAHRLYVFNTKYRTLGVYYATGHAGFEVKGTSLKAFDTEASFITTLRKPTEVLTAIMSSTPKQIDKLLDGMKCKKRKGNGRINPQTVLVRVVETRV